MSLLTLLSDSYGNASSIAWMSPIEAASSALRAASRCNKLKEKNVFTP
jgi:hypothetical protein